MTTKGGRLCPPLQRSQLKNFHGYVPGRYIDKWLNTDNTNDPPAPSCGPTQSSPEGAGESLVNTYVPNVDIRNTWEY